MMQKQLTVEELSRKLKPIFGNKIDNLYFQYSTAESSEEKNEILQVLTSLYQRNLNKLLDKQILLEPPENSQINAEYPLANINYAGKQLYPFCLREKDWPRHVCISGMSGSGKTTLAFNILKNFIEKDKPFLVFDWKKSFRSLMTSDASIMCFTVGNNKVSNLFKTNINRPPEGVSPKEWIKVLCDLLTESFCVSFGVHKVLLETLDEIFEGWEVYKGSEHYPNWQHVKKMLEIKAREARGRETGWYESALRIASVLTFGDFGKVVNYDGKKSLSVEDLFDKKIIFELNSLNNIEKKFFCEFILTYIYKYKKAKQNKVDEGFNHAILVDEAHNVFLKNKTHFVSESVTDMIYREMREYGTGLICLDQHISKLSDTVTGNSACHIAFQQQLPQDIFNISSLMQLTDRKEIFSQLPVGSAIVKLSERFTTPFLINAPFIDLKNNMISDEKIANKMKCVVQGIEVEKDDPEFKRALILEPTEDVLNEVSETPVSEIIYEIPKIEKPKPVETPFLELKKPKVVKEKKKIEKAKIKKQSDLKEKPKLSKVQKVLYEFARNKLDEGMILKEIEKLLETGLHEKQYTEADIWKTINHIFKNKFKESKEIISENHKEKITVEIIPNAIVNEEKKFMSFLILNPSHQDSTTEFYKKVGLSTRKGNIIKNKLLEKNMIKIEEEKNRSGWKKFIRPIQNHIH